MEASPRTNARIAGLLYMMVVATGMYALMAGSSVNVGDLTNFASFLDPSLGSSLSAWMPPVGGLCEILFTLWLLAMGVNSAKWREQNGAAGLAHAA
jgi:hypothetical protein